ncbi:MAG: hypothetical protein HY658_05380 [Actinobacteria bacterium]|nr:hypothetical protein [Actinomycetota bacterium]
MNAAVEARGESGSRVLRLVLDAGRGLAVGMAPGAIAGFLAGGVGSRLAMRVLALTSPDRSGFLTEAGATVGEVTVGGTVFLLFAGTGVGLLGGIAYLVLRPLLLESGWRQGVLLGLVLTALGGRFLVDPGNVDFVILRPAWLAVAMFLALPFLFGWLLVPLAERMEPAIRRSRPLAVLVPVALGLAFLCLLGGAGLLVAAAALAAASFRGRLTPGAVRSLVLYGRILLVAGLAVAGTATARAALHVLG